MPPNPAMPKDYAFACRFDRIFHSCHANMQYDANPPLKLVGNGKVKAAGGMTASDHMGMCIGLRFRGAEGGDGEGVKDEVRMRCAIHCSALN
jgi:hypothetical protein